MRIYNRSGRHTKQTLFFPLSVSNLDSHSSTQLTRPTEDRGFVRHLFLVLRSSECSQLICGHGFLRFQSARKILDDWASFDRSLPLLQVKLLWEALGRVQQRGAGSLWDTVLDAVILAAPESIWKLSEESRHLLPVSTLQLERKRKKETSPSTAEKRSRSNQLAPVLPSMTRPSPSSAANTTTERNALLHSSRISSSYAPAASLLPPFSPPGGWNGSRVNSNGTMIFFGSSPLTTGSFGSPPLPYSLDFHPFNVAPLVIRRPQAAPAAHGTADAGAPPLPAAPPRGLRDPTIGNLSQQGQNRPTTTPTAPKKLKFGPTTHLLPPFPDVPNGRGWPSPSELNQAQVAQGTQQRIRLNGLREHEWKGVTISMTGYKAPKPCSRCANQALFKTLGSGCRVMVGLDRVEIRGCSVCHFDGFGAICEISGDAKCDEAQRSAAGVENRGNVTTRPTIAGGKAPNQSGGRVWTRAHDEAMIPNTLGPQRRKQKAAQRV